MVRKKALANNRGFTLVELLIVVAIIGVLSTVGIPTFRRMIQKSKKSEAQVNLGNLFTVESAFFSEYGGYGNNIGRMGFQIDGASPNLTYVVGFPQGVSCQADGLAAQIEPQAGDGTIGPAIQNSNPQYFNVSGAFGPIANPAAVNGTTLSGRNSIAAAGVCQAAAPAAGANSNRVAAGGAAIGIAVDPDVANNFATFRAVAIGCVRQGVDRNTCVPNGAAVLANFDVWHMNQARELTNEQDGVL